MTDYDIDRLDDREFESLAVDLVSQREGQPLERFKAGRDQGIDGRLLKEGGKLLVVQAKHWAKSTVSHLLSALRDKELPKINRLNPHRYILVTSLQLSPADKQKIIVLLGAYVRIPGNIVGRDEMNNFLAGNADVARRYYRLWLTSTEVLRFFDERGIDAISKEELRKAKEFAPRFVATEAFSRAAQKLEKLGSVILVGEPGIGKTTVAEQLMLKYAIEGYRPLVVEGDLEMANKAFVEGEKQFYYFDDFLGQNYLEAIEGRSESAILRFMRQVQNDRTKRFVLTSRTTIIQRYVSLSEKFRQAGVDRHNFEIKVDELKWIEKAEILANHIWVDGLAPEFAEQIYQDRRYLSIIKHRTFNPRLIEFITDAKRLADSQVKSEAYWKYVEDRLANPAEIWEGTFTRQLDDIGRLMVALVVFDGYSIEEDAIRSAMEASELKKRSGKSAPEWELAVTASLKTCIGSVISRRKHGDGRPITLVLFNPSVGDYVLRRFGQDPDSIVEFCRCLRSSATVYRLAALQRQKFITDETRLAVIEKLAREYLPDPLSAPLLALALAQEVRSNEVLGVRLDVEIKQFYPRIFELAPYCAEMEELGALGGAVLECELISRDDPRWVDFVHEVMNKTTLDEPLTSLSIVINQLKGPTRDTMITEFKAHVLDVWRSNIDMFVRDADVLREYSDSEEAYLARRKLRGWLRDKFSEFQVEFNEQEIDDISDECDVGMILSENLDAKLDDSGSRSDVHHPDPFNAADIADLFERRRCHRNP